MNNRELLSEKDFNFITSKYGTFKAKRELIEKLLKDGYKEALEDMDKVIEEYIVNEISPITTENSRIINDLRRELRILKEKFAVEKTDKTEAKK